jgi:hypothetical protein
MAWRSQPTDLVVGEFRRKRSLHTSATYRVLEIEPAHVLLEVCDVPGLAAGVTLRVTRSAAREMEVVRGAARRGHDAAADAA